MPKRKRWVATYSPNATVFGQIAPEPPPMPTKWELFAQAEGICETNIKSQKVRNWVEKHYRSCYVPPKVLKALRIWERD